MTSNWVGSFRQHYTAMAKRSINCQENSISSKKRSAAGSFSQQKVIPAFEARQTWRWGFRRHTLSQFEWHPRSPRHASQELHFHSGRRGRAEQSGTWKGGLSRRRTVRSGFLVDAACVPISLAPFRPRLCRLRKRATGEVAIRRRWSRSKRTAYVTVRRHCRTAPSLHLRILPHSPLLMEEKSASHHLMDLLGARESSRRFIGSTGAG